MDAQALIIPLIANFSCCFTKPGFEHFQRFVLARMALLGLPHCVTEVLRLSRWHEVKHWTTPYKFFRRGRYSCSDLSQCLLLLMLEHLGRVDELVVAIDDTLAKKVGKRLFGLGLYVDPTNKNPGAHRQRVYGHCWVVMALLWWQNGRWWPLPLSCRLFVPQSQCERYQMGYLSKIDLAVLMLQKMCWLSKRLVLVVDNLYAKAQLAGLEALGQTEVVLISRLRSNAALYEFPPPKRPGQRGRQRLRGDKVKAQQLYRRRSKRRQLVVNIYGKTVTLDAFVDILLPSPRLGSKPILVVIFPQRSGKRMNIFFTTDVQMDPVTLLETYSARFQIEQLFAEIKQRGGFSDCRQRSFQAIRLHAMISLISYSLLQLLALIRSELSSLECDPWYAPKGPPSVTRLRRAVLRSWSFSPTLATHSKPPDYLMHAQVA